MKKHILISMVIILFACISCNVTLVSGTVTFSIEDSEDKEINLIIE